MKTRYYIAIAAATLVMGGCSDSFLDHNPDERTEIDSPTKVVQLLAHAYPDGNPGWLGEVYSDNLIDNQSPHLPSNPNESPVMAHYNFAQYYVSDNQSFRFEPATQAMYDEYDSPGQLWMGYYNSIAYTNFALDAINKLLAQGDSLTESLRAARGEAELLRAYDHFMLVSYFSNGYRGEASKNDVGVPYVTETENVVRKHYDRGNVYDVYQKIQQDLEAGLRDISDVNFTTAPKYHFNTNAAHAFAARFYLFSRQYEKCIEQANMVLGTDSVTTQRMTMDYSVFHGCSTTDDFCNAWQSPNRNNNLMLIPTSSVNARRFIGYRYSCAGPAVRAVYMMYNDLPLKSGYICPPQAIVSGMLFSISGNDYGFFNSKIWETFQFTNKVAGIGNPYVVYRAFTGNELLLERAEAKVMLGRYDDAAQDLMAYWNYGIASFSDADKHAYVDPQYARRLTPDLIRRYFGRKDNRNPNVLNDWNFASVMGLNIPEEAVKYMNCINQFRRFENSFEGMRLLDIKRWGMTVTHSVGVHSEIITAGPLSPKLNIEVPWESIQAGMQSSRDTTVVPGTGINTLSMPKVGVNQSKVVVTSNEKLRMKE